jgi:hypothetical protein
VIRNLAKVDPKEAQTLISQIVTATSAPQPEAFSLAPGASRYMPNPTAPGAPGSPIFGPPDPSVPTGYGRFTAPERPPTPSGFSLSPGQLHFVPDQGATGEAVRLGQGGPTINVPRGYRLVQGPPATPTETSIDRHRTEMLGKLIESGQQAAGQAQELEALVDPLLRIGQAAPSGTWAGFAARLGIQVPSGPRVTDLQVVQSILDGLTPLQRRGLPGAASDKDMATFRGRLPDLMRTAEGNREIMAFLLAQARAMAMAGHYANGAFTSERVPPEVALRNAQEIRFEDILEQTRREIEDRSGSILESTTGINVRDIGRMTDIQLRDFAQQMARRFPTGIPDGIRRRIRARAEQIERSGGN